VIAVCDIELILRELAWADNNARGLNAEVVTLPQLSSVLSQVIKNE